MEWLAAYNNVLFPLVQEGETPDSSILEGMLWLIGSIDKHFVELDARVRDEAEEQVSRPPDFHNSPAVLRTKEWSLIQF